VPRTIGHDSVTQAESGRLKKFATFGCRDNCHIQTRDVEVVAQAPFCRAVTVKIRKQEAAKRGANKGRQPVRTAISSRHRADCVKEEKVTTKARGRSGQSVV